MPVLVCPWCDVCPVKPSVGLTRTCRLKDTLGGSRPPGRLVAVGRRSSLRSGSRDSVEARGALAGAVRRPAPDPGAAVVLPRSPARYTGQSTGTADPTAVVVPVVRSPARYLVHAMAASPRSPPGYCCQPPGSVLEVPTAGAGVLVARWPSRTTVPTAVTAASPPATMPTMATWASVATRPTGLECAGHTGRPVFGWVGGPQGGRGHDGLLARGHGVLVLLDGRPVFAERAVGRVCRPGVRCLSAAWRASTPLAGSSGWSAPGL